MLFLVPGRFFAARRSALGRSALGRLLLWRRGCVDVCVSAKLMYCAQTTESIIMRSSRDCSPAFLVFPYQIQIR